MSKGWKLASYQELQYLMRILTYNYRTGKGLQLLGSWNSTDCCITVAGGFRLTADGTSFVYPSLVSNHGVVARQCTAATDYYHMDRRYRLTYFQNGRNLQDLSTINQLSASEGAGACRAHKHESNPGIYVAKIAGVTNAYTKCCIIDVAKGERLCAADEE